MKAAVVVVIDAGGDGGADAVGRGGVEGVLVEGSVVALDLAVGLRVVHGGADVGEAGEVDEAADVAGDELRAVVGDDPRTGAGMRLEGALEDEFDVGLGHAIEEVPVDDVAAVALIVGNPAVGQGSPAPPPARPPRPRRSRPRRRAGSLPRV